MNLNLELKKYQKYINKNLKKINKYADSNHLLYLNKVIDYSLLSNGKRIRPILNILFFEHFGGKKEDIVDFSLSIEMIHTYSLIHDDLPAMDDDLLRRRKATSHIKFDQASAILAGDALLNLAYENMLDYLDENFNKNVLKACRYLAKCSGKEGMIVGQIADMELSNPTESIDNLEFINLNKTAKLIRASVVTSGFITNQSEKVIHLLEKYSDYLGLAFQLKDDLLEYTSDQKSLGKSIESDKKNNKKTYVAFKGIEQTKRKLENLKENTFNILNQLNIEDDIIYELTKYIFLRKY
mgnify:CR=1 FL=1